MKPRIRKVKGLWHAYMPEEVHAFADALNAAQTPVFYMSGPKGDSAFDTPETVTDALLSQMPEHLACERGNVLLILKDLPSGGGRAARNPDTKETFVIWKE